MHTDECDFVLIVFVSEGKRILFISYHGYSWDFSQMAHICKDYSYKKIIEEFLLLQNIQCWSDVLADWEYKKELVCFISWIFMSKGTNTLSTSHFVELL
jgi:hypothetical protein